jgi:protein-L-isoaspartate(D-aspartate) O-methyltransferase
MVESAVQTQSDTELWASAVAEWIQIAAIVDPDLERSIFEAFVRVRREDFLPEGEQRERYQDEVSQIGSEQLLFKPTALMRMCALAEVGKRKRILVLGAGSGYLCAVLNALGAQVFGIEVIVSMAQSTRKVLDKLGHHAVWIQRGDGRKGWDEVAPFDAIIGCYEVQDETTLPVEQVKIGATIVAPLQCADGIRLAAWNKHPQGLHRTIFEKIDC